MSTTARKARKRDGIPFIHPTKTPTPPEQRSFVTQPVPGADSTKHAGSVMGRSKKKIEQYLSRFTPTEGNDKVLSRSSEG